MIKIDSKENCVGCNACQQKCPKRCISMIEDEEGFTYPKVNLNDCIDCHLCETVCPVIHSGKKSQPIETYASFNRDEKIRISSSSGGIFHELCRAILNENGIIFGSQFNNKFEVITTYTDNIKDIAKFQGSKYVQTNNNDSYALVKKFLIDGKKILFSGTPCQIKGLLNFLGKEYSNLVCVDFVCHGVPSPLIWRNYLKNIHLDKSFRNEDGINLNKKSEIAGVSFRDKKFGWNPFCMSVTTSDEIHYYSPIKRNLYMKAFLNDIILRPCCYKCHFKSFSSGSDFTLCDFWGIQDLPISDKIPDIRHGVSGLFINTSKGQSYFQQMNISSFTSSVSDILIQNPSINISAKCPDNRYLFFRDYINGNDLMPLLKKYSALPLKKRFRYTLIKVIKKAGLLNIIRNFYEKKYRNSHTSV